MKTFREASLLGIVLFSLWWLAVSRFSIPDYFLPSPFQVGQAFVRDGAELIHAFYFTFLEAVSGLFLATSVALALGMGSYFLPRLGRFFHPLVILSQALPMLVLSPLIVLWLGLGWNARLTIIVLSLFFPIFATFLAGLQAVSSLYLDLAYTLQATRWRLFFKVVLPSSLPYLFSGLKVAVTWSVLSAIVSEWVGGSEGLGFIMQNALSRLDAPLLFAALLILILSTLIFYFLMSIILGWGSRKFKGEA